MEGYGTSWPTNGSVRIYGFCFEPRYCDTQEVQSNHRAVARIMSNSDNWYTTFGGVNQGTYKSQKYTRPHVFIQKPSALDIVEFMFGYLPDDGPKEFYLLVKRRHGNR